MKLRPKTLEYRLDKSEIEQAIRIALDVSEDAKITFDIQEQRDFTDRISFGFGLVGATVKVNFQE